MSRERRNEDKVKCTACRCDGCKKRQEKADEMSVNWCEMGDMDEEYLVNYAIGSRRVMVLDIGAPVSLVGKEWIEEYLGEHEMSMEDLESQKCEQVFKFGPSKKYVSRKIIGVPIGVERIDGNKDELKVFAYVVDAEVPFLIGRKTLQE